MNWNQRYAHDDDDDDDLKTYVFPMPKNNDQVLRHLLRDHLHDDQNTGFLGPDGYREWDEDELRDIHQTALEDSPKHTPEKFEDWLSQFHDDEHNTHMYSSIDGDGKIHEHDGQPEHWRKWL